MLELKLKFFVRLLLKHEGLLSYPRQLAQPLLLKRDFFEVVALLLQLNLVIKFKRALHFFAVALSVSRVDFLRRLLGLAATAVEQQKLRLGVRVRPMLLLRGSVGAVGFEKS